MNNKRNRVEVKRRLLEVATYALTDVLLYEGRTETIPVRWTWDGTSPTTTAMYLGQLTGRTDNTSISGVTKDDVFQVDCQVYIAGSPDGIKAEQAAEAALNAFDAVLRPMQALRDMAGDVPETDPPATWAVASASITDQIGPYHTFPQPAGTKTIPGVVEFSIACVTNLK